MLRARVVMALAVALAVVVAVSPLAFAHHKPGHQGPGPAWTPTPSPSPSPTPTPTPRSSSQRRNAAAEDAAGELALSLAATPPTLERLEIGSFVAVVSNEGAAALERVRVEVKLPLSLKLETTDPDAFDVDGGPQGETVTFMLASLESGATSMVTITAKADQVDPDAIVSVLAGADGADSVSTSVVVPIEETTLDSLGLALEARSDLLVQVNDEVDYVITVSNTTDQDLDGVIVVDLVPSEVEVGGVALPSGVEAVQVGDHKGRSDIVWNVGILEAGSSVDLTWRGTAARVGDLQAENFVQVKLQETVAVERSHRTFLGAADFVRPDNPKHFKPIKKRVVVYRPVPESPTVLGARLLPVTGLSPAAVSGIALMLVIAGAALLGLSRSRRRLRPVPVLVVLCLVMSACVATDGEPETAAQPSAGVSQSPDEVLGERITNPGDGNGNGSPSPGTTSPEGSGDQPGDGTSPSQGAPEVPGDEAPVVVAAAEPVPVVEIVEIGLDELPVDEQASRGGDNVMTYTWDEAAGRILQAASSVSFDASATSEILTSVSLDQGSIDAMVTLTNLSDNRRLAIKGRLLHKVFGPDGLLATFESQPIDVVLAPGGSVDAQFSYLLPTGDYRVEGGFSSD